MLLDNFHVWGLFFRALKREPGMTWSNEGVKGVEPGVKRNLEKKCVDVKDDFFSS
jgi:hypothetical protein